MSSRAHDLKSDLELALRLADVADEISLKRYQALDLIIETKPDASPVTDADKAVESAIRSEISKLRSEDLVVGEQQGKIMKTNLGIFKLFGYSQFEVQGHDVNILMPSLIA